RLRSKIPHLAITTDIIVGFPGESDQAFQKTLKAMEEIEFDQAFMFIYSPRRDTEAALMEDQVPYDVANRRLQELLQHSKSLFERKNQALVGSSTEVLVEGFSEKDPHRLCGRTRTNKMVIFDLPDSNGNNFSTRKELLIGQLVKVQLTTARLWGWEGVLCG
ncbi:MAG: TRAM domain-containing protein, partial [bacterium]